jgi:hypothetical protein
MAGKIYTRSSSRLIRSPTGDRRPKQLDRRPFELPARKINRRAIRLLIFFSPEMKFLTNSVSSDESHATTPSRVSCERVSTLRFFLSGPRHGILIAAGTRQGGESLVGGTLLIKDFLK